MRTPPGTINIASPLGGLRAVVDGARALAQREASGVLAVVIETSGSTYRKPGALILLEAAGICVGALSGGCLEAELENSAGAVLGGHAREVVFDTSGDEDRLFGSGTGCGGTMQVLLLPLPARVSPLRDALVDADVRGATLTLHLMRAPALSPGSGSAIVHADGAQREFHFDAYGATTHAALCDDHVTALTIAPAPRMLICGAGPETAALVLMSRLQGWHVELLEHRQRWLRFATACAIDCVHGDRPDALGKLLARERFDVALVMNHNFDLDARCLAHFATTSIGYVGLLGPSARRDELLHEIGDDVAAHLGARLHAPIGLPLGGEGAEAIALAIVAGLQQFLSRRSMQAPAGAA